MEAIIKVQISNTLRKLEAEYSVFNDVVIIDRVYDYKSGSVPKDITDDIMDDVQGKVENYHKKLMTGQPGDRLNWKRRTM